MKKIKVLNLLACVAFILLIIPCVSVLIRSENRNESGDRQRKIGALYMTMNNPYFEVLNGEIETYVKSRGDVLIARDSSLDEDMQIRQVREMIKEKADILLINAVDWKKITPALEEAKKAGIPVIALDAKVYDQDLVASTVVSDNYEAGAACAGDLMTRKDGGRILFLVQSNNRSAVERIEGFKDTLEEAGWDYTSVGEIECMGQLEIAEPQVSELLNAGEKIDVVMALNDPAAQGAMAALDARGELENVLVYGVDGSPTSKMMISEKRMTATASQSPVTLGEKAMENTYRLLEGDKVESLVTVSTVLINQENIGQFSLTGWQ